MPAGYSPIVVFDMARPISIAIGLLVSGFALSACGGGSSGALSMPEYIQQADAICQRGHRQLESSQGELEDNGKTVADRAHLLAEVMHGELDSLHGLNPPPAQRSAVESMIAMGETQIENVEALADAVESDDQVKTQRVLSEGRLEQQRLSSFAHQLGFRVCGGAG
jgi:hypothetical protein